MRAIILAFLIFLCSMGHSYIIIDPSFPWAFVARYYFGEKFKDCKLELDTPRKLVYSLSGSVYEFYGETAYTIMIFKDGKIDSFVLVYRYFSGFRADIYPVAKRVRIDRR